MPSNSGYLKSATGILKLTTIVMLAITLGLAYFSSLGSEYTTKRDDHRDRFTGAEVKILWREYLLLGVATLCFIMSLIGLIANYCSIDVYWNKSTAYIDFVYHSIMGLLLMIFGMLFVMNAVMLYDINCKRDFGCQHFEVKLAAGAFATMTGLVFAITGTIVMTNRKDVERERLMDNPSSSTSFNVGEPTTTSN